MKYQKFAAALAAVVSVSLLAGSLSVFSADEVKTIHVANAAMPKPYSYLGDDGEVTGYDIEVIKAIFEQLPQTFIMKDVKALKGSEYSDGTLYSIISRWVKDGWIEKTGKNSCTKTNSNRPSTNV